MARPPPAAAAAAAASVGGARGESARPAGPAQERPAAAAAQVVSAEILAEILAGQRDIVQALRDINGSIIALTDVCRQLLQRQNE